MDVSVLIVAENDEDLRQLSVWLGGDEELRGRVFTRSGSVTIGELGAGVDSLLAVLAPGGVAVALVGGLVSWLQSRTSRVRLRLERPDGGVVELETRVAGRLAAAQLPAVADGLAAWVFGAPLSPVVAGVVNRPASARPGTAGTGEAG